MSQSSRPGARRQEELAPGLPMRRHGKVVVGDANMKASGSCSQCNLAACHAGIHGHRVRELVCRPRLQQRLLL